VIFYIFLRLFAFICFLLGCWWMECFQEDVFRLILSFCEYEIRRCLILERCELLAENFINMLPCKNIPWTFIVQCNIFSLVEKWLNDKATSFFGYEFLLPKTNWLELQRKRSVKINPAWNNEIVEKVRDLYINKKTSRKNDSKQDELEEKRDLFKKCLPKPVEQVLSVKTKSTQDARVGLGCLEQDDCLMETYAQYWCLKYTEPTRHSFREHTWKKGHRRRRKAKETRMMERVGKWKNREAEVPEKMEPEAEDWVDELSAFLANYNWEEPEPERLPCGCRGSYCHCGYDSDSTDPILDYKKYYHDYYDDEYDDEYDDDYDHDRIADCSGYYHHYD
jgi:hypothetical protein